jgi:NAD(P)-dependent dehydrogenase (short-subunit alcohol dehydrogenase family)
METAWGTVREAAGTDTEQAGRRRRATRERSDGFINLFYDVAKGSINRMTFGMARELRPHNITVVAVAPGFIRTERVAASFEAVGNRDYLNFTESPEYVGRAVVDWWPPADPC